MSIFIVCVEANDENWTASIYSKIIAGCASDTQSFPTEKDAWDWVNSITGGRHFVEG